MNLTALIACKDRETNLTHCLASINNCAPRPNVIVVDFGSAQPLKRFEKQYDWLTVIRVTRNTKLFHKARALNIGLKQIRTEFFCATDTDQIFQSNFFGTVCNRLNSVKRSVVLCKSHFIHRHPTETDFYAQLLKEARATGRRLHGEGCCTGLPTKWTQNVRGWDERYIGYGAEDSDIILRAKLCKFKLVWINKLTSTIHMPHPKKSAYYSAKKYLLPNRRRYLQRKQNKDIIVNTNKRWGQL
jgi:glycosyltransferase involved in cell wall biosynthesis